MNSRAEEAKRLYPRAEWIGGDGEWFVASRVAPITVLLCPSFEMAEAVGEHLSLHGVEGEVGKLPPWGGGEASTPMATSGALAQRRARP